MEFPVTAMCEEQRLLVVKDQDHKIKVSLSVCVFVTNDIFNKAHKHHYSLHLVLPPAVLQSISW